MGIDNNHKITSKFDFKINRKEDGTLIGFTLTALKGDEAVEIFCKTFPLAIHQRQGSLKVCADSLWLQNNLCSPELTNLFLLIDEKNIKEFQKSRKFKILFHNEKCGFSVILIQS